jgi:hypothetical protein
MLAYLAQRTQSRDKTLSISSFNTLLLAYGCICDMAVNFVKSCSYFQPQYKLVDREDKTSYQKSPFREIRNYWESIHYIFWQIILIETSSSQFYRPRLL